jgi:hypothetical protein
VVVIIMLAVLNLGLILLCTSGIAFVLMQDRQVKRGR